MLGYTMKLNLVKSQWFIKSVTYKLQKVGPPLIVGNKMLGKDIVCIIKLSVFFLMVCPVLHHPGGDACREAGVRAIVSVLTPPLVVVA